ncbi:MAG: prolipoprotein diacylglyceryl transferase [Anaerolineales bacterium]|nr:prolipoprotein diacylglyceryl transferase [Anaerolineales bacterium]
MDGLSLGPLLLRWNGLLIMLGVTAGAALAMTRAKRRGYDSEIILDLILPTMIWGTIFARLWHVFTPSLSALQLGLTTRHYLTHPLDLLAIWVGGLGFPGALIGGCVALFFFCRIYEYNFAELADVLAPAIALGQAIGRLGSYFNQELVGLPTAVAWKMFVAPGQRLGGYEAVEFYHPLFAYAALLDLANLILLLWVARRFSEKLRAGDLFLLYLFVQALIRFSLEFLRLDVALIQGVNINQVFMALVAVGVGLLWRLRRKTVRPL